MRAIPFFLLAGCASSDRLLARLPADANLWWVDASRDTVAYVDRQNTRATVIVGPKKYGPYV
jgi:hypothetical protein